MRMISNNDALERPPLSAYMSRSNATRPKDWLAHYSQLLNAWRRRGPQREDAEDALQDTVASMLENGVGIIDEPRAYLHRSVYHRMVSMHRKHAVRAALPLHECPEDAHPVTASAEESWAAQQLADALIAALSELPPDCQEAFKLHRLEGWPHDRIAARLGVSRNMVERHMMRAMRHLQDKLQHHGL